MDTPCDTQAPCPWTCSFGWCLAEGYWNGDQRRPMDHWASGRTELFELYSSTFSAANRTYWVGRRAASSSTGGFGGCCWRNKWSIRSIKWMRNWAVDRSSRCSVDGLLSHREPSMYVTELSHIWLHKSVCPLQLWHCWLYKIKTIIIIIIISGKELCSSNISLCQSAAVVVLIAFLITHANLSRSAWVERSDSFVCLALCLFVCLCEWFQSVQTWYREWSWDVLQVTW